MQVCTGSSDSRNVANADWKANMVTGHSRILELVRAGDERPLRSRPSAPTSTSATSASATSSYRRQGTAESAPSIKAAAESYLLT